MSAARFEPSGPLRGHYEPPPDKSISHRAALFAAMADEPVTVHNYLDAADTQSTLTALRALRAALEATGSLLDVGNSGTLLRLLPGWLAGQRGGVWTLDGDDSIRRRPVDRVVEPLNAMGAQLTARGGRLPPLTVRGSGVSGIVFELPVGSAPVKS